MTHSLIAIGCNKYDNTIDLAGAEHDATEIFSHLTNSKYGTCDASSSVLITSPSLADLQKSLAEITCTLTRGDLISFFFAGHGFVKNGLFYMCVRDTVPERIGVTAFSLNSLLSLIQEISPQHANILIDACNSGGVAGDFKRAISPDNIGKTDTTGICLFAACSSDQYAYEIDGAGAFTSKVIGCINGRTFVNDTSGNLDLADISATVSQGQLQAQQPVFWGLNLTGRPNFCLNPHVSPDSPLRKVLAEATPFNIPTESKTALQEILTSLEKSWSPEKLQRALTPIFAEPALSATLKLSFSGQLLLPFRSKAQASTDPFREVEVTIGCLAPLLNLCSFNSDVETYVAGECTALAGTVLRKIGELDNALDDDEYALLGDTGIGELFQLPLRISKVLGWLGWALFVQKFNGDAVDQTVAKTLIEKVLDKYPGSLRSMSEAQAPYIYAIGAALAGSPLHEHLEELLGHLFSDACDSRGAVCASDIRPEDILEFLLARSQAEDPRLDLLARPSTLVYVLLVLAAKLKLDDAFDSGLIDLDHVWTNAFTPKSYMDYSLERIAEGNNATFEIGHGIWTVDDVRKNLTIDTLKPETKGIALLSSACSLLFPDRVAWHMLQ